MTIKTQKVETAMMKNEIEDNKLKIKISENHSVKYLEKLKKTTYKGKKVVFILANGREYE